MIKTTTKLMKVNHTIEVEETQILNKKAKHSHSHI